MSNTESSSTQEIKKEALSKVENLSAEDMVRYIRKGIVTLDEFRATGDLDSSKRKRAQALLAEFQQEDTDFNNANTLDKLEAFAKKYPKSGHIGEVNIMIDRMRNEAEDADFNNADTVEKMEAFVKKYPKSGHIGEAGLKIDRMRQETEEAEFNNANTLDKLEAFMKKYPTSGRIGEARAKIDRMRIEAEDADFNNADTIEKLEAFAKKYPASRHTGEINMRINQIKRRIEEENNARKMTEERERMEWIYNIIRNINAYTPGLFKQKYGENVLQYVCQRIGIPYDIVYNYEEPELDFNDDVPKHRINIPSNYTDVFFWGVPSSGKSCALSAILNTIRQEYTMDNPLKIEDVFGAKYRNSLASLFSKGEDNNIGYLPSATNVDRTQYMPFRLRRRRESEKDYRNISFFELSGEIFKCFYDIVNDRTRSKSSEQEEQSKRFAFNTLNMMLKCRNPKVHCFFIDYNQSKQKRQEQMEYLRAAATYFTSKYDIFEEKTMAVYIIVTKADEITRDDGIKAENDVERSRIARDFLKLHFGGFVDVIKKRCEEHSVPFYASIFSIGDVYFSKICRINRRYSIDIIDDLLKKIPPAKSGWFGL